MITFSEGVRAFLEKKTSYCPIFKLTPFKLGKRNAIHIGGRAAFRNRCGLQYALFDFKGRKYSLFLRKCRL